MSKKQQLEQIAVESLIPYARNARKHSDEQVAQIAASIREFGFNAPVLVDADNGIIAGHGRVLAARKLGLAEVPCVRLSHLTDTQRRAYVLADNKLALNAEWDEEMLGLELSNLREVDFDLTLTGFDESETSTSHESEQQKSDVQIYSVFEVVAECQHEEEQQMVYNILNEKGIKCRLSTL
jgi:ParB-like chromosome segregation protein Spo0J